VLQDYVTPSSLALVGVVHLACLLALADVLRSRPPAMPGWRMVTPGGTYWFCFLASWAFAGLVSWVWLFVGSARADAAAQMRYALALITGFGIAAAWSGFHIAKIRRLALRWRGRTVQWRVRGKDMTQDMTNLVAYRRVFIREAHHLHFRDGTRLKLDAYSGRGNELLATMAEWVDLDFE
jgi:hypothetical protein